MLGVDGKCLAHKISKSWVRLLLGGKFASILILKHIPWENNIFPLLIFLKCYFKPLCNILPATVGVNFVI